MGETLVKIPKKQDLCPLYTDAFWPSCNLSELESDPVQLGLVSPIPPDPVPVVSLVPPPRLTKQIPPVHENIRFSGLYLPFSASSARRIPPLSFEISGGGHSEIGG